MAGVRRAAATRSTRVALGQVATSAHDEALYLLLHTLHLPLDSAARGARAAAHRRGARRGGNGAAPPHPRPRARGLPHARGVARPPPLLRRRTRHHSAQLLSRDHPAARPAAEKPGRRDPRAPTWAPARAVSPSCSPTGFRARRSTPSTSPPPPWPWPGSTWSGTTSRRRVTLHRSDVFAAVPPGALRRHRLQPAL